MNIKDNKSSEELKGEVLHELKTVKSDLDRLQNRLTPGQLIDDALLTSVGKNPRAIFEHLAANPVGTTFLSLGTFLLMENDSHLTHESQLRDSSRNQVSLLRDKFSKKDVPQRTGEIALGQGGELGESSIDHLKENLEVKVGSIKNIDPLTLAAIGAGLGALTGIALPISQKEQTLVDQKLGGTLKTFQSEFQEALNQSVNVLKEEFVSKFNDLDVNIFEKKNLATNSRR